MLHFFPEKEREKKEETAFLRLKIMAKKAAATVSELPIRHMKNAKRNKIPVTAFPKATTSYFIKQNTEGHRISKVTKGAIERIQGMLGTAISALVNASMMGLSSRDNRKTLTMDDVNFAATKLFKNKYINPNIKQNTVKRRKNKKNGENEGESKKSSIKGEIKIKKPKKAGSAPKVKFEKKEKE